MAFDLGKEEFRRKALPPGLDKAVDVSLSLITLAEGCLGLTSYKVGGEEGNIGLDVWVLGDYEGEIWTKRHHISFASIGHALGDVYEEEYVSHSDCDSECFPDHVPRILIMGELEILLRFIGEAPMLLYDLEQKTFRRIMNWQFKLVAQEQVVATKKAKGEEAVKEMTSPFDVVAAKKAGREDVEEITIPFDVVAEFILPNASARDLVRFRSVCKSWRQLIDDPNFIHNYLRRHDLTLHQEPPPSFTSIRNQHHVHQVIAYTSGYRKMGRTERGGLYCMDIKCEDTNGRIEDNGKPIRILGLEYCLKDVGFNMLPPCKGLVLFKNMIAPLYLCNPVTGEYTSLPQSSIALSLYFCCYGFGFDDHSKEFKVLHVWKVQPCWKDDEVEVFYHEILSLGKDCSWRQLGRLPFRWYNCQHPGIPFNSSLHWIVCAGGKTLGDNSLMAFDLRKEEFERKALPPGLDKEAYIWLGLMTLVEGCLGLTSYNFGGEAGNIGLDVWVLGDYEGEIWTKRHHISFPNIGHGLGDAYEEECVLDYEMLIMGEHEILLRFIEQAPVLLYDLELKTFRKFVVDGNGKMFLSDRPPPYIYEQHPGSAYFVSVLRSWSRMISLGVGQDGINADGSPV
ncbi:F-box/kelch-repeat protein [Nymphaea thermarum]|nr:F-box/kelch-repeat protein [Nymphaea thermarum]